jgi:hypothetical protein
MNGAPTMTVGPAAADRAGLEQARLELAATAARAERRNRPTALPAGAAALLAVSIVALLWAAAKRSSAELALADERRAAEEYVQASARLEQARALGGDRPNPANESNDRIRSRIIAAAERAGMTADHPGMTGASSLVPTVSTDLKQPASADGKTPATQRSKFTYQNVKQSSLEAMIQWVNNAVEDIPGLEVFMISVKPEANGWNMTVAFTRWERVGP